MPRNRSLFQRVLAGGALGPGWRAFVITGQEISGTTRQRSFQLFVPVPQVRRAFVHKLEFEKGGSGFTEGTDRHSLGDDAPLLVGGCSADHRLLGLLHAAEGQSGGHKAPVVRQDQGEAPSFFFPQKKSRSRRRRRFDEATEEASLISSSFPQGAQKNSRSSAARIPQACLLMGSPATGKTLPSRAPFCG